MMNLLIGLFIGLYAGAALFTYAVIGGSQANRIVSALIWPTFPLWP